MDNDITSKRERLNSLSYNDVRKEAKRHGVSGRGKKAEIIEKILEVTASITTDIEATDLDTSHYDDHNTEMETAVDGSVEEENEEVVMSTVVLSSRTALNETFTISTHSEDHDFLSDDEDHTQHGENAKPSTDVLVNVSMISENAPLVSSATALSSAKSEKVTDNLVTTQIASDWEMDTQSIENASMLSKEAITSTPRSVTRLSKLGRFERQHAALFEKMESIGDVNSRMKERIGKRDSTVSSRLKLAMPKRAAERKDAAIFSTPTNPKNLSFKFGDVPVEDFTKVQRTAVHTPVPAARRSSLRLSLGDSVDKKTDVKQLTKSASKLMARARSASAARHVIYATTPVMSARLERLATPRGHARPPLDGEERTDGTPKYTPHKGRYQYVDTTKMSDEKLAAHMAAKAAAK